jgi:hypothetical protein
VKTKSIGSIDHKVGVTRVNKLPTRIVCVHQSCGGTPLLQPLRCNTAIVSIVALANYDQNLLAIRPAEHLASYLRHCIASTFNKDRFVMLASG